MKRSSGSYIGMYLGMYHIATRMGLLVRWGGQMTKHPWSCDILLANIVAAHVLLDECLPSM